MVALDPEQEFINHLAVKESAESLMREGIPDDLLVMHETKIFYNFVKNYVKKSNSFPTPEVLLTEFGVEFDAPKSSVEWVIDQIKERYKRSQVEALGYSLANNLHEPDKALASVREMVVEIDKNTASHRGVWSLRDDFPLFFSDLQDDIINNGTHRGFSLGFPDIDVFTGGCRPGQLIVMAARPKRKKTFFMLLSFISQIKQGHSPSFFTLELTDKEIMLRLACLVTEFPWDKAQRGDISSAKDWKYLEDGWKDFVDAYPGNPHVIQPSSGERTASQMIAMADKLGSDSIFVSQLKHIRAPFSLKNDFQSYNDIVLELKHAAINTNRPIILEAQLNREAQNVKELRDMDLAQLGLSDAIGQTSDLLMGLTGTKDMFDTGLTEFGIIESRNTDKNSWVIESVFDTETKFTLIGDA